MDRPTFYYGEVLRDTDLLNVSKDAMVALAKISEATLGTATCVDGFTLTPTSPASMSAIVGPGQVYEQENLEGSPWGSLGTDSHTIVKQGIALDPQSITFSPPSTTGYAQNFLVEVQYLDIDGGSVVLPYYNAANPAVPFSGPGNAGTAQNTVRQGAVSVQVKAGIAATAGTQTTPTPDAGWVGLFTVTVANGQSSITAGNIAPYANAPFIPVKLPGIPAAVQAGKWTYAQDQGSASALIANLSPTPASITEGMAINVKAAYAPTGATNITVNGNAGAVKRRGGTDVVANDWAVGDILGLRYTGSVWQLTGLVKSDISVSLADSQIWHLGTAGGTANTITTTLSPAPAAGAANYFSAVQHGATNTGAATLNGAPVVIGKTGNALVGGEIPTTDRAQYFFDGTSQRLLNPAAPSVFTAVTASGNVTPPPGARAAELIVTGGGAGGAGANASCGAGGGAGATAFKFLALSGTAALAIAIGAGGAAGAASGSFSGGAGGTTSVTYSGSTVASAAGGGGQSSGVGSGTVAGPGGATGAGDLVVKGGSGCAGSITTSGVPAMNGGASYWGGGGAGSFYPRDGYAYDPGGQEGQAFGSGGGGGSASSGGYTAPGGAGANGIVFIRWIF